MHHHIIEISLHQTQHLVIPARLFLRHQDIPDGRDNERAGAVLACRFQHGEEFEPHLPSAEREQLRNQYIGFLLMIDVEQHICPFLTPFIVNLLPFLIDQHLEIKVRRPRRGKLDQPRTAEIDINFMPAGDDRHIEARAHHVAGQCRGSL